MENVRHYTKVMVFSIALYGLVAMAFGEYMLFGFGSEKLRLPLVTESMPRKSPVTWAVKLLYCVVVMLTFPLMVYPAQKVIDSHVSDKWLQSPKKMIVENITRIFLVVFASIVALSVWNQIPHLNGLAGAVACCPMAFTLPALFHLKLGLAKTRT